MIYNYGDFNRIKNYSPLNFKRCTGISLYSFALILNKLQIHFDDLHKNNPLSKRGLKPTISLENKLLLTLYYLRDYPTFIKLGQTFGISESYANKIYHIILNVIIKYFHVPNRKELLNKELDTVIIDVTEQPIERPVKKQKQYYSGKKKRHTIKIQLIICLLTLKILSVVCEKGRVHDFKIYKESKLPIHPDIKIKADSGYQGIQKLVENSEIPIKESKKKKLTKQERQHNKKLAKTRIYIEHTNRKCKIFRITKETYRGKHKNYSKTWNVVAALVNMQYDEAA